MAKILVLYYSAYGHIETMANGHDRRVMDFGLPNYQIVLQPIINKWR